VTAQGVKDLSELQNLTALRLSFTKVQPTATNDLKKLKGLKVLSLSGVKFSKDQIKELERALFGCTILD
jgi:hypothetical protein